MDYNTARDRLVIETVVAGADEAKRKLEGVAAATDKVTVASEKQERARRTHISGFERMMAQIDKTVAAEQKHVRQIEQVNRYLSEGTIGAGQYSRALDLINRRHTETMAAAQKAAAANDNLARSTGLARHELVNLGRQANDVVVSLAGGQGLGTVLLQQGSQIADVFVAGNKSVGEFGKQALGWLTSLLTPARLVAGGITGIAVAGAYAVNEYVNAQREARLALTGVGRMSGATPGMLGEIAEGSAGRANLSVPAARTMAGRLSSTGRIAPEVLPEMLDFTRRYAWQRNLNIEEATGISAERFADPARGAAEFNKELGGLSATTQRYIEQQQKLGNLTAAQNALMAAMAPALADAEKHVTTLGGAWEKTNRALENFMGAYGRGIVDTATGGAIERQLKEVEAKLDFAQKFMASAPNMPGRSSSLEATNLQSLKDQREELQGRLNNEREMARIRAQALRDQAQSLVVKPLIDRLDPDIERRRQLEDERGVLDLLRRTTGALKALGMSSEDATRMFEGTDLALKNFKTTAERMREEGDLAVKSALAETPAQRAAIEAQRAYQQTLTSTRNEVLANIAAENARNVALAESTRAARDAFREAGNQAKLIGLKPYDRRMEEIRQEHERDMRLYGPGAGAAPSAGGGRVSGLDEGFAAKVRALFAAIEQAGGSYTQTSGYRDPAYNARVGGVPGSNHTKGLAVDLLVSDPALLREAAARLGLRVLPSNGGAWHVDAGLGARGGGGVPGAGAFDLKRSVAERGAYDAAFSEPIRQAQRDVEELRVANDNLSRSFGQSAQQIDEVNNLTKLLNQARRESNGEINPKYIADAERVAKAMAEQQERQRQLNRQFEEMRRFVSDLQGAFGGALNGFLSDLLEGKSATEALRNSIKRLAADLTSMAANMAIRALFQGLFGQYAGGGGSGGGLLGNLLAPLFGSSGGGVNTNYGSVGSASFHTGGIVGFDAGPMRSMPALTFAGAPRFHGGLAPDEFPAILQRGEGVFTPKQMAAMGGGATVNVSMVTYNNNGSQVRTEKRDDGNGGLTIETYIDNANAAAMERPGSASNRALEGRGAKRALTHY